MENLEIYENVRSVPSNAQKTIQGGKLKGMTDINPMWRIKKLTEQFGPVGFGWRYNITDKRLESGPNGLIAAFVQIELFYKIGDEWSMPVVGIGGSSFVAQEKGQLVISDECYKMALTDAISVACKAIGMGADIYWDKDVTKYSDIPNQQADKPSTKKQRVFDRNDSDLINKLIDLVNGTNLCGKNTKLEKWGLDNFTSVFGNFSIDDYKFLLDKSGCLKA